MAEKSPLMLKHLPAAILASKPIKIYKQYILCFMLRSLGMQKEKEKDKIQHGCFPPKTN